jgi:hypothetical protein
MARTETIKFNEFMSGEYKVKTKKAIKKAKAASSTLIPAASAGAAALAVSKTTFAASTVQTTAPAVPVGAKEWMGEQTLSALAHALDPVVDILVALSFPVASVIIVGACFFFMFGNSEKAWTTIQNAGLGYVLIQVSPVILAVLKQVGNAV